MALDIVITSDRLVRDPEGRRLVDFLKEHETEMGLEDAVLYYDFPSYVDYEGSPHKADSLILSRVYGIIPFKILGYPSEPDLFYTSAGDSLGQL